MLSGKLVHKFFEKIWYEGKQIGTVSGILEMSELPYLRQMLCGIHTEEGFCRVYPSFLKTKNIRSIEIISNYTDLPMEVIIYDDK